MSHSLIDMRISNLLGVFWGVLRVVYVCGASFVTHTCVSAAAPQGLVDQVLDVLRGGAAWVARRLGLIDENAVEEYDL